MSAYGAEPAFVGVLVAYFLVVGGIGVYGYLNTEDETDFLVAGREVGPVVGGATLVATQISAGTFVGAFGIHYLFGVGFIWVWTGLWTGWLVSLVLVAPQIRRFGRMTVPDFLASRYADDGADGNRVRAIGAALIVLVSTVFLTAQITAGGLIFEAVFGLPRTTGMVVMVAISIAYTFFGGMRASVLTDFVQAVIMVGGIVLAIPLVYQVTGGIAGLAELFQSVDPSIVGQSFSRRDLAGFFLAFALARVASPRAISRFYAMRDENTVRQAIVVSLGLQVVVAVAVAYLGIAVRAMFPRLGTPDLAALVMGLEVLGPFLGGLLVAAILSAALSTIDSIMLVSSAGIAHDIYGSLLDPAATERQRLWANRLAVLFVGAVALGLSLNRGLLGGLVGLIVVLQASMMGGALFFPLLLGLHWKRVSTTGGTLGMIAGFITVVLWHVGTEIRSFVPGTLARLAGDPVVPGAIVSLVTLVVVSALTGPPSDRSLEPFFRGRTGDDPADDD